MDEQNIFGEQPETVETSLEVNVESSPQEAEQEVEPTLSEAERGVPIGKFKSVDDLYDAYNNLQAEFTRKCQRLAEIEKEKTSENSQNTVENNFNEFLSKNQEAVLYVDEIKKRATQNESLKNDKDAFDKAWASILFEKLTSPNKAKEPLVQNFVLHDNDLKNLVIENYMKQLQEQKTPVVMSSGAGERVTAKPVTPKPDSFEQAKQVVLDMFS